MTSADGAAATVSGGAATVSGAAATVSGAAATVSAADGRAAQVPAASARPADLASPASTSGIGFGLGPGGSDHAERRPALVLAALLLLAGVLVGLSPALRIVVTADGSGTTTAWIASFVAVLPGVLALALTGYRTLGGLAATAGAGVIGVVRLLADLGVLTAADSISRPELFAETSDSARPFTPGAGAWLLLAADVLWLAVGVLAATRLAAATTIGELGPRSDAIFGRSTSTSDPGGVDRSPSAPGSGQPESSVESPAVRTVLGPALSHRQLAGRPLNLPMVGVGFVGAVLLMVGALGTPYTGGYLALRVLPFGSSISGLIAAALLGFVTAIAVLVAGALPRPVARALLLGVALAAAVPSLTAVVAVLTGAPVSLSPVVWCGLLGALTVACTGLLAGEGSIRVRPGDPDGAPPAQWLSIGTGVAAVLAALSLFGAAHTALLYLDGAPPDDTFGGALGPAGPPLLVAAIPLAVAGVLALIRPVAEFGRTAIAVLWAGAVYAFGQALLARSLVLSTAGDSSTSAHSWTTGPGQWLTLLGTLLALTAAVLAGVTARRVSQASLEIVDDASLDTARTARRWPAVALTLLILVALSLPIHRSLIGSSSTLVNGYDLDTWGLWALGIGSIGAVWAGALTRRATVAAALLVAAAALVCQPLFVPAAFRAVPGFELSVGFWAGGVTVLALLVAAGYFGRAAGRVQTSRPPPLGVTALGPAGGRDGTYRGPDEARAGTSSRSTSTSKGGSK
ncbi:MAG: hypothetical protein ABJD68_09155 [Nakamurella sp.]